MIAQRKKTFCITKNPQVAVPIAKKDLKNEDIQIKYFTDCVYHSLIYPVPFNLQTNLHQQQKSTEKSQTLLKMNFQFLINQTKMHKKIFDNIGVINIKTLQQLFRYGILITEEKGQIYVSLIQ